MRDFWIRLVSILLIGGILLNYNKVLEARQKDEQILELTAELENAQALMEAEALQETESTLSGADGVYEGKAQGFGGVIKAAVSMEDGKIQDIQITEAEGEDNAYLSMAKDIIPSILEAQSADVDIISGATFSSTGIREAVAQALDKAVQSNE